MKAIIPLLLGLLATSLPAADTIALCIGNNAYTRIEDQLDTPINDATLIKQSLERLPGGADVTLVTDGTKEAIEIKLNAFKAKAAGGRYKLALFYYSGHGVEDEPTGYGKRETFLLPIDAVILNADQLPTRAVALDTIMAKLADMPTTVRAVILDCCRTGAPKATASLIGATKSIDGDLDERVKAALGKEVIADSTLIAFAASPGRKAAAFLKESDSNSPFTTFLAQQFDSGTGNIRDLVEAAAATTEQRTERRQVPYVSYNGAASSLQSTIFRRAPSGSTSGSSPAPAAPQAANTVTNPQLLKALADLAALDAIMNAERRNYKTAIDTINRYTNFKRSGVRENSPGYFECMKASKAIQDVEAVAKDRITECARLEATVRALGGDPAVVRTQSRPVEQTPPAPPAKP